MTTPRKGLRFVSLRHLRKWLTRHPEGRRILGEEAEALVEGYTPVLVVLSCDGFVEVYGPPDVGVRVVNRLCVSSKETALLADSYLDAMLPKSYRRWYWPRHLRGGGLLRKATAEDELQRRLDLEWLRVCDEL